MEIISYPEGGMFQGSGVHPWKSEMGVSQNEWTPFGVANLKGQAKGKAPKADQLLRGNPVTPIKLSFHLPKCIVVFRFGSKHACPKGMDLLTLGCPILASHFSVMAPKGDLVLAGP